LFQDKKEIGKVNTAQQHPDRRHYHIVHKALDDGSERASYDYTGSHVHHVSPHGEFLELFEYVRQFVLLFGRELSRCSFANIHSGEACLRKPGGTPPCKSNTTLNMSLFQKYFRYDTDGTPVRETITKR
jgi:hypothetical protein